MKLVTVILFLPLMGWAGVSDFNALINENAQVQKELQKNLNTADQNAKAALEPQQVNTVVMKSATYNIPTNKKVLKFQKEIKQHQPSTKKELDRLAQELKDARQY